MTLLWGREKNAPSNNKKKMKGRSTSLLPEKEKNIQGMKDPLLLEGEEDFKITKTLICRGRGNRSSRKRGLTLNRKEGINSLLVEGKKGEKGKEGPINEGTLYALF